MKRVSLAVALGLLLATLYPSTAEEPAKKESPAAKTNPGKSKSLRQPGFVFLELGTDKVDDYVAFFRAIGGFEPVDLEKDWAWLQSERGDLMFGPGGGVPNKGKPPGSARVVGLEIGIVVDDLEQAYQTAGTFAEKGFVIKGKIERRPWGPRDFRLLSPDGYYLRITEPM